MTGLHPPGPAGRGDAPGALLIVAHGSRDPRHAAAVSALTARVRALAPNLRVATGFLDFSIPGIGEALDGLHAAGERHVVALPLLLSRAFHAKTDIPAALAAHRDRLPGLTVQQADVLGPRTPAGTPAGAAEALLTAALERRLAQAGLRAEDRSRTGVVLAAAGSTDPEALAGIARLARHWRRTGRWCAVRPAFASASSPTTAEAVRALRADGIDRVAVAPYVIAPGRLPDRILSGAREAGADLVAAVLGPSPELARLMLLRYRAALAADSRTRLAG
ncbi:sirohydrochlorin chelatase [Streptomyces sp. DSM 44917]|uniref:Sirohydrochlorin chelatase n=1 Tax=Streptomyces boetiae TaxID=3075541 RepID=A0ABU2L2I5_9ACTN|nr:sirohydrochlorin chelatase [Streptomyces sp. DSM 44917]MDT0305730.1 sirohydrochlorin chelatase [Streptomyces sp. DSM 44917]